MAEKSAVDINSTEGSDSASTTKLTIAERHADVTLQFVEQYGDSTPPLTEQEKKKATRKKWWYLVILITLVNLTLYVDKATLSYGSLLDMFEETHIDNTQYNNLNTLYYVGFAVGQVPGHYLIQHLPLGKYVAATVFLWSVIIFLHDVAKNYGGLIALRFFLGFVESSLIPAMEVTLGMFFDSEERAALQPIFWISCMGAPIPAGFIAYGLLWSKSSIYPWKFFMIITGGFSTILSAVCWFFYPDNPVQAKFLNRAEKLYTIQRVHESTRGSIEQKQFKRYQAVEALRDPLSWLFALQTFTLMLSNNLAYQQNLLFLSLGVSNLGSTLVSAASGGYSVASCIVAYFFMKWFPNNSAYWGVFWILPAIAGGIGMVTVPWDNKLGLLACLILAGGSFGITWIAGLGWTTSSASGYTKKMTRNVMFMMGYSVSNIISPQIWVARDSPRYYPAWIVQIVISWVLTPVLLLIIRVILARRNKERQEWIAQQRDGGSLGVVEQVDDDGQVVRTTVDVAFLDLTDLENKYFIYPL